MRLLDTRTGEFVEKDPRKDVNLKYAILSHTWDPEGEQTNQVLRKIQQRYDPKLQPLDPVSLPDPESSIHSDTDIPPHPTKSIPSNSSPRYEEGRQKLPPRSIWDDPELSPKIREACAVACANGYQYIWIDSCCIDKTSSAELSEAINSMYAWYARAEVCYAYLADVPPAEDHRKPRSDFRTSVWFTRGWTLQELIAPLNVLFLSEDWVPIGPKYAFADLIQEITGISEEALLHVEPLDRFSVAQRLSWASGRETTRVEDQAYSLLGIFDINMPTLYGEGNRAFRRLQEEIMQRVPDQSLFAWGEVYLGPPIFNTVNTTPERPRPVSFQPQVPTSPLAMEPRFFGDCYAVSASSHDIIRHVHLEYVSSPYGIRTQFQMLPLSLLLPPDSLRHRRRETEEDSQYYLAILGCQHAERPGHLLGRVCYISPSESGVDFVYPGYVNISPRSLLHGKVMTPDLFPLPPETVEQYRQYIQSKTVYISHPDRHDHKAAQADTSQPHHNINLLLLTKTRKALRAQGYTVGFRGPEKSHYTGTHWLTLSHYKYDITVEFQHTLDSDGGRLTITARVEVLGRHSVSGAAGESESSRADPSTVTWTDSYPWRARLGQHNGVRLNIGDAEVLILRLRLDLICAEAYLLHVEVLASNDPPTATSSSPVRPLPVEEGGVVGVDAHGDVHRDDEEADGGA